MMTESFKSFIAINEEKIAEAEALLNDSVRAVEAAQQRGELAAADAAEMKRQANCQRENFATARAWLRSGNKVPHEMVYGPRRMARSLLSDLTGLVEKRRMTLPAWQRAARTREGRLAEMRKQLDSDLAATRPPRSMAEREAELDQRRREVYGW
jgi:hypothetical protein